MVATRRGREAAMGTAPDQDKRPACRPRRSRYEGITIRHSVRCASRQERNCNCNPGYQAQAYSRGDGKTLRKTFPTLAAAKAWRADAQSAIRRGTLRGAGDVTIAEAGAELIKGNARWLDPQPAQATA